ncbi:hypothetical protein HGD85_04645 [Rhodobacteraceae bacterium R_SAG10]|jgi:hypothetical protein|nr:hypothetical protein [Rhodobacteraceae bacterium R_SAG10]
MRLREICHSRAGDKGDVSNISLIVYDMADYEIARREVTAERVRAHFRGIVFGEVERYELPGIGALNFVLHQALDGGVTRSLRVDAHGKSLSSYLLSMDIDVPSEHA